MRASGVAVEKRFGVRLISDWCGMQGTDKSVKRQRQGKKGDQSSPFCMHVRPVCHTLHIGRSFLSCPLQATAPRSHTVLIIATDGYLLFVVVPIGEEMCVIFFYKSFRSLLDVKCESGGRLGAKRSKTANSAK